MEGGIECVLRGDYSDAKFARYVSRGTRDIEGTARNPSSVYLIFVP